MREVRAGSIGHEGSGRADPSEGHHGRRAFVVVEAAALDPARIAERGRSLRGTLVRRGVLCLRFARPLDDAELQVVAGLFGPIKEPVARTVQGGRFRYSDRRQIIDSGFVLTAALREKLGDLQLGGLDDRRPGLFESFHTDDSFTDAPAMATVLHARELPSGAGGATRFLDMRAAYEALDPRIRERIDDLRVAYAYNNRGAFPPRRPAFGEGECLAKVGHPLVRTHPVAGTRALFLDLDRATHIEGMAIDEGRALLQSLQDHAEASAPRTRHVWRDHDVLVWDNASVQHSAAGDFAVGEPRRFWRYMIAGPRPE